MQPEFHVHTSNSLSTNHKQPMASEFQVRITADQIISRLDESYRARMKYMLYGIAMGVILGMATFALILDLRK